MKVRPKVLVMSVAAAVLVAATGFGAEEVRAEADAPPPLGPGDVTIRLGIEHSLFELDEIRVVEGTRVRFVVDNGDPIGHELIVGDAAVHARHAQGTHPFHPPIPGEVSVDPTAEAMTVFAFDEPGIVEFACHLPRHYEYGMHGKIVVVPASTDDD
jgi:uncharacterized cupredoxin-like copper-binding protein